MNKRPPPSSGSTFIGIEAGGSRTRMLVQQGDESPQYYERPVSIKVRDGNAAASASNLQKILSELPGLDGSATRLTVAIGLSGMSRTEDQASLKAALVALPFFHHAKLHLEGDATLTLKAAIPEEEEGILLIIGTGSVIYYRTDDGQVRRIGGWGPLLSDDGSGYRIGLRALRRYIGVLDGIYPRAALSNAIAMRLGPEERDDRTAITRRAASDPEFVASIASDAFQTAATLEGVRDFIYEELVDLFTMLSSIVFSNVLRGPKPYTLYLSGSIAKHPITQDAIRMSFEETDLSLVLVDDLAPCAKALEIARSLTLESAPFRPAEGGTGIHSSSFTRHRG
ncbi:MAG: BadF/BadG/BcrA/BcrD ATPase family protein [Bacteroidota bacterium]|nr:BadF/BadG/BcrA/BcrD ATPase family protein [Bacteroidota bacterium]MDP4232958.1 BadF/BadG/BcrA/BcrD ATPase family protein [Bacteroidota bacterium]MDP4242002.1 BadF/BadG/BcrA/BcrD ATPase family protein [Bacteroidota bacterium]MDP4286905.1 BadF/BadG/BcrA/BcrD ATPase family protein [Bacteroidota bacterium]